MKHSRESTPADPLEDVVSLLQPRAALSKIVRGAGAWRVRRTDDGRPFYCVVLEGSCRLEVDRNAPIGIRAGDFVLVPAAYGFTMSSVAQTAPAMLLENGAAGIGDCEMRLGDRTGPTDVQLLVGHCVFDSPDSALLVSLLPQLVHVRGERRLETLVELVRDESRARRPARDFILNHLLAVLLIEALRGTDATDLAPGLVRGLADERLAAALRRMHDVVRPWTVAQLAREAALSRSAFFTRFNRAVGVPPMEYLLAWRMALAKRLLRDEGAGIADVAERIGYGSASAFSVAFTRHVGLPPARYAREAATSAR